MSPRGWRIRLRLKDEGLHIFKLLVAHVGGFEFQGGAERLGVGGVVGKHIVVAGNRHLGFDEAGKRRSEAGAVYLPPRHVKSQSQSVHCAAMRKDC